MLGSDILRRVRKRQELRRPASAPSAASGAARLPSKRLRGRSPRGGAYLPRFRVSEEDAFINTMLEALSRQPAAADDKAEEVYAVESARAIFRDAERVADEDEQKKIAK